MPRFAPFLAAAATAALAVSALATPGAAAPASAGAASRRADGAGALVGGRARPAPALVGQPAAALGMPGRSVAGRPSVAAPAGASTVQVTGFGLGPGIGMGQYGAYGYASEKPWHWSAATILAHYYGNLWLRPVSSSLDRAPITVNLSELDGASRTTVRAARSGAHLVVGGKAEPTGTAAITLQHPGGTKALAVTASAGDVSVELPGGVWRSYLGTIELEPVSIDQTWSVVPLEAYLTGVVPSESIPSWGATGGEAALEAQAVAARSYALNYVVGFGRTCDNQVCQVYAGDPATIPGLGTYATYTDRAVSATAGEVLCSSKASTCPAADIVSTQYSSSTGGYTAGPSAGSPYPAVVDAGDTVAGNPNHAWSATVALATVEAAYPQVGTVTRLVVITRNGDGAYGGRALEVRITGTRGRVDDTGTDVAAALGLRSDWFGFASEPG